MDNSWKSYQSPEKNASPHNVFLDTNVAFSDEKSRTKLRTFFSTGPKSFKKIGFFWSRSFCQKILPGTKEATSITRPINFARWLNFWAQIAKIVRSLNTYSEKSWTNFYFWTRWRLLLFTYWEISIKSRKFLDWSRRKIMKRTLYGSRIFYPQLFSEQIECILVTLPKKSSSNVW